MNAPMVGSWSVDVQRVTPFTIHGDEYHELIVTVVGDASQAPHVLRVPRHAAPELPRAGDALTVNFLMGQVTSVLRRSVAM